jgi:predicted site-specific integrase-resolvase
MGEWIPLMDYAMKTGVSLSTLRRYIKANKIRYRVENGRYLLPLDLSISDASPSAGDATVAELKKMLQKMSSDLQRAREENVELKTLVAFYESNRNT